MNPPELNRELLVKVVDHALSASNWEQDFWCSKTECGTAMCIAGFVAIDFLGGVPVFNSVFANTGHVMYKGRTHLIRTLAKQELGLTEGEADRLFAGSNDEEDVRRISEQILNSR